MPTSAKNAIASELLRLRKAPGPLTPAKMTAARAIVRGLGADDPEVAMIRLVGLAQEHADDREISAALASLGWGSSAITVLDRLNEFAAVHYVDDRTVRRWSDEGLKKLVLLILGTEPWIQPHVRQVIRQRGNELQLGLQLRLPPNLRMNSPELSVNGKNIELGLPPVELKPIEQRFAGEFRTFAVLEHLPTTVRVRWFGEKYPTYESVVRASEQVTISSRLGFTYLQTVIQRSELSPG